MAVDTKRTKGGKGELKNGNGEKKVKSSGSGGYTADDITVLKGLEAVRRRPAMYIGDTSARGLHHLVYEVVDNSIDEALAGYCKNITVMINGDGSVTVDDDGRGIPTDMHPQEKRSALEVVMTVLHAGGKFDKNTYKVSGGLHGVGVSVVNALSEWLEVEVSRDGKMFYQKYKKGDPVAAVKMVGKSEKGKTGTKIRFLPDGSIFKVRTFKFETLAERLRELAFLNPEVVLRIEDTRTKAGEEEVFHFEGGLREFVQYIDATRPSIIKKPFYTKGQGEDESGRSTDDNAAIHASDERENLSEVIDYDATLKRLGGDTRLFRRMATLFVEDAPSLIETMRECITTGDPAPLHRAAHSLKGLAANFGARDVVTKALRLEEMGKSSRLDEAGQILLELEREIERLEQAFAAYRADTPLGSTAPAQ